MAHQLDGGIAASPDGVAPTVRVEPCAEFRIDPTASWPVCACGWLDSDHAPIDTTAAVVRALPRRRAPLPERKAS
jgi:hypothetical protein